MRKILLPAVLLALAAAGAAHAQNTHINPAKSFISSAVKVPAGSDMIYVSGQLADPIAPAAAGAPAQLGDTKTQALSVFGKIKKILEDEGYKLSDVVMMRVVLVGDPAKGGAMDFAGMNEAYLSFWGPIEGKPARIASQIVALARPGALVEIEVQAAKAPMKAPMKAAMKPAMAPKKK
ncbi:Rid family hydrolase [Phenylobacterium sp.]|uniref:Rid family hydrolase n=1 Tax=Phenylobacterium sp. TaxID=1871053 RepID=UPI0025EB9098|nr:Rid family hydrolase [Phenylobacterium sp.]